MHPDTATTEKVATTQVATEEFDLERKERERCRHKSENARTGRVMYVSEIVSRIRPEVLSEWMSAEESSI
jgi:hypothetical protein